jgi:LysM repeat protein
MKKTYHFIFILAILLALSLGACTRSASQPSSDEGEGSLPLPTMGTQEPMDLLEEMATQTAMAQEAGAQEGDAAAEEGTAEEGTSEEAVSEEGTAEEGAAEGTTPEEGGTAEGETAGETEAEAGGGEEPVTTPKEYKVPDTYTLKSGEFPYCIARRFNISPVALLSANGLNINSSVYPGTKLTIPKNAGAFDSGSRALRSHPTNYTVVSGDTVFSIACLFGDVDPRAIEEVNGFSGSYTLSAGQVIKIP